MAPMDGMTQNPVDPGAAMPQGGGPPHTDPTGQSKTPEAQAGYMELAGASKDGDCQKVEVQGGISTALGCCNLFEPKDEQVSEFKCGTCKYSEGGESPDNEQGEKQEGLPAEHPLNQLRAKPKGLGL